MAHAGETTSVTFATIPFSSLFSHRALVLVQILALGLALVLVRGLAHVRVTVAWLSRIKSQIPSQGGLVHPIHLLQKVSNLLIRGIDREGKLIGRVDRVC